MRYTLNTDLIQSLTVILNESVFSISKYVSTCTHDTISRFLKRGDMRIETFLEICNAYQLDYRYFFDVQATSATIEQLVVQNEDWTPIEYHTERIPNYGRDYDKIWLSDFAVLISKRGLKMDIVLTGGRTSQQPMDTASTVTDEEKRLPHSAANVVYNALLFKSFPSIVGKTGTAIFVELFKNHNTYSYAVARGDIRVRTLVDVCNAYRISIEHFFCFDGKQQIPLNIITPESEWKPVIFHSERFNDFCVAVSKRGDGMMDLCRKLGYSVQRFQRTVSDSSPISMCDLIEACRKLGCSPLYFFDTEVSQTNARTYSSLHRRIQELENQLQRTTAEKNQAESRLRHATAMLDMKKSITE